MKFFYADSLDLVDPVFDFEAEKSRNPKRVPQRDDVYAHELMEGERPYDGLLVSKAIWQDGWAVARYDALVVYAVALQAGFLLFRLETLAEAKVILLFHLTGTAMDAFSTVTPSIVSVPDGE